MNITIDDLLMLAPLSVHHLDSLHGKIIAGVSTDSRTVKQGEIFFALRGETFDGHEFIERAFKRGA